MFEILTVAIFLWLLAKSIGLAFKLTWGAAKIVASVLMAVALPILVLCLIFAGGVALLAPIIMVAEAVGILKACL